MNTLTERRNIRKANQEDSGRIGFIHYTAWIETYTGMILPDYFAAKSIEKSTAIFRANKCNNIVVAEADGEIVGFCGFGEFREHDKYKIGGEIHGIYLLNEFKRRHFGSELIEYALKQLKISGYNEAGLWVLEANKSAIAFYEKQEFVYSGISREADMGNPVLELLYTKRL